MAWDWLAKGAKMAAELGGEYRQHHALVERLLDMEPDPARAEFDRVWPSLDERARAGVRMTLAGLTLAQQGTRNRGQAAVRADRLQRLWALVEAPSASTGPAAASPVATVTASAARATHAAAGVAERLKPTAEQLFATAQKHIKTHGPTVEAVARAALAEFLAAQSGSTAGASSAPGAPPPIPQTDAPPPAATPAAARAASDRSIAGVWTGVLRSGNDGFEVTFRFAPSGRLVWGYTDTSGPHNLELTHTGQKIQYVPPGGGVVTIVVQSVTGAATESSYLVDYSFERASNGYMSQEYQQIALACTLEGVQVQARYETTGFRGFGDKTGMAGGNDTRQYAGMLTRLPDEPAPR